MYQPCYLINSSCICIDDFTPAPRLQTKEEIIAALEDNYKLPDLPPHNGFGTHEDSAINCRTVFPFASTKSCKQFLEKDKYVSPAQLSILTLNIGNFAWFCNDGWLNQTGGIRNKDSMICFTQRFYFRRKYIFKRHETPFIFKQNTTIFHFRSKTVSLYFMCLTTAGDWPTDPSRILSF